MKLSARHVRQHNPQEHHCDSRIHCQGAARMSSCFAATPQLAFFLEVRQGHISALKVSMHSSSGQNNHSLMPMPGAPRSPQFRLLEQRRPPSQYAPTRRHRVADAPLFWRPGPHRRLRCPRNTHAASRRHLGTEHRVDRRAVRSALQGPVAGGATDPSVDDRNRDGCVCGAPGYPPPRRVVRATSGRELDSLSRRHVLGYFVHGGRLRICMRASCPFGSAMSRHGLPTAHQSTQPQ